MNNITWSEKSSATHDNGERNLCWRKGLPETDGKYLFTSKWGELIILTKNLHVFHTEDGFGVDTEDIVAYMKLPTPYKPD